MSLTFAALADPTRRRVLDRLARGPASVTELASAHELSVPGMLKHLRVLEGAALLRTAKDGRVRRCGITPAPMRAAAKYLDEFRNLWEHRFDALADLMRRMEGTKK
jgi:DNA-binding transcriptional ArsR family regulator